MILDADLAKMYGVTTKRLNEQVKRNIKKFPADFAFQITKIEFSNLKSHFATSSSQHGGKRKLPFVFTEHGAIMAANVLNSKQAVQMSVFVVRAFVKMRSLLSNRNDLAKELQALLFILFLQSFNLFKGKEDYFLSVKYVSHQYENGMPTEVPAVELFLITEDNNLVKYLENIYTIANDLHRIGAKVIVAKTPHVISGIDSKRVRELQHKIDSLRFVVLAGVTNSQTQSLRETKTLANDVSMSLFSAEPSSNHWHPITEWKKTRYVYSEIDASLLVAKKYFHVADSIQPRRIGNEIVFGDICIPVHPGGFAYANHYRNIQSPPFFAVRDAELPYGPAEAEKDVMHYVDRNTGERVKNLEYFRKEFEGKVVVIAWFNQSDWTSGFNAPPSIHVINGLLLKVFYSYNQNLFILLLLSSIAGTILSTIKFPVIWSIVVSSTLVILVNVLGIWLFLEFRIIVETLYIVVAVVLSLITFSLMKLLQKTS